MSTIETGAPNYYPQKRYFLLEENLSNPEDLAIDNLSEHVKRGVLDKFEDLCLIYLGFGDKRKYEIPQNKKGTIMQSLKHCCPGKVS